MSNAPISSKRNQTKGPNMSWEPELEELKRREAFAAEPGGAERKTTEGWRPAYTERVGAVADAGSHEIGVPGLAEYDGNNDLMKLTPSNFVFDGPRLMAAR